MKWWEYYGWIIINVPQVLFILNIIFGFEFTKKKRRWTIAVVCVGVVYVVYLMTHSYALEINRTLLTSMIFALVCMKGKIKIIKTFIAYVIKAVLSVIVYKSICIINVDLVFLEEYISLIILTGFLIMYKMFEIKKLSESRSMLIKFISGTMFLMGTFSTIIPICISNYQNDRYLIMLIIACILFIISSFMLLYLSMKNYDYKLSETVAKEKEKLLSNYFDDVKANSYEMRRFKHDYKNHMRSIQYLITEKKYDEAVEYINEISENELINNKVVDVGHDFVNAILNDYIRKSYDEDITIRVSGVIPKHIKVGNVDWSTILSNGISNAIEATKEADIDEKNIDISFKTLDNKLFIQITNKSSKNIQIVNGEIKTTKKDKVNHGIGIKNMKDAIEKYAGSLNYEFEEDKNILKTNIIVCSFE